MLPSLTEIILLVLIVICIFGLGRIGDFSEAIGEMRARHKKGLPPEDAIDITPEHERGQREAAAPRPGTREPPVDDAHVDDHQPGSEA